MQRVRRRKIREYDEVLEHQISELNCEIQNEGWFETCSLSLMSVLSVRLPAHRSDFVDLQAFLISWHLTFLHLICLKYMLW